MVVAEVLTGIALVKQATDFIKQNIETAKDIGDIAGEIDNLIKGESESQKARFKKARGFSNFDTESVAQETIDAKLAELEAEYDAKQYQRDRQYPQLGEPLDMLFHDMTAGKGTKDGEWYKAVAKVKADNPKPTE